MRIDPLTPPAAMLAELGRRLAEIRKQQGLTQEALAEQAGVGVATLRRIEDGRDARLGSWLRLLQALEMAGAIDGLLPEDFRSPLAEARAAAGKRPPKRGGPDFVWGDERAVTTATVRLWGTAIGYVSMDRGERFARFEHDPDFAASGIELAPLAMPLRRRHVYRFPEFAPHSFHGLPGLLADSLPDRYGNKLIDVWLARTGRSRDDFNAVDRLCYTGRRGMGALEFEPSTRPEEFQDRPLEVAQLVELAALAFAERDALSVRLEGAHDDRALLDLLSVGTSAGGARAKAVIAYHPGSGEIRSGQTDLRHGFEHWLIKFDGVAFNGDWGVADPAGYGLLEYAYSKIAADCGIAMSPCRLLRENGRSHFMTRRFDRDDAGPKRFVQTFGALAHFDYYDSGAHSYEQLFQTMKRLGVPPAAFEEQFRRVVFNLVGCNQDDHVKNFAFTMDRRGRWDLTPAYDLCHAEGSDFTRAHQLSVNGRRSDFTRDDLKLLAEHAGLPRGREQRILDRTLEAFGRWPELAKELAIPATLVRHVGRTLRLSW